VTGGDAKQEEAVQRGVEAREDCRLYTLAKNHAAQVQRCAKCGALSLHLGPLTLRFDAAALESLWNVIGQALLQLHDDEEERAPLPMRSRVPAGRA
jgi:hypothetical protein